MCDAYVDSHAVGSSPVPTAASSHQRCAWQPGLPQGTSASTITEIHAALRHRWLGHVTMLIITVHSLGEYGVVSLMTLSTSIHTAWLAGLEILCNNALIGMIASSQCSASQLKSPCHCCKQGTTSTGLASRCPSGINLRTGAAAGRHIGTTPGPNHRVQ